MYGPEAILSGVNKGFGESTEGNLLNCIKGV